MLSVNTVIDGRFRIEDNLAKDSKGEVYRALDLESNQQTVVKVLRPSASFDSNEALNRRLQEFKLLRRLNHPNSVSVIQTGLFGEDVFYVAMEYLTGRTLTEVIQDEGALDPQRVARIVEQSASVLDAAHESNIVHRDIKPGNIFLHVDEEGNETVKLIGFVFAKILSSEPNANLNMTQAGVAVGTPEFMSPEQAMGRKATKLSDVYSLGVLTYAALTGSLPFTGKSSLDIMLSHVKDPIPPMKSRNPKCNVPPLVEATVRKAMAKELQHRPMSAGEFARLFRLALDAPDQIPPGTFREEMLVSAAESAAAGKKSGSSNTGNVLLVIVMLIVLAVLGGLLFYSP